MKTKKPTIPELVEKRRERVEKHLNNYIETDTGCWEFQGCRSKKGYGTVCFSKEKGSKRIHLYLLHRVSYCYHNHIDPASLVVRHDCDNPCCINPAHLRLGTMADNSRDCVERGRRPSKLTNEDVLNIKKRLRVGKETLAGIAKDFGVHFTCIHQIKTGRGWRHIQLPSETVTKELQNPQQLSLFV